MHRILFSIANKGVCPAQQQAEGTYMYALVPKSMHERDTHLPQVGLGGCHKWQVYLKPEAQVNVTTVLSKPVGAVVYPRFRPLVLQVR